MDLRIIVLLSLQLDLLSLELEGAAFFGAGPFNRMPRGRASAFR
jgi:hypothetical protein